MSWFGFKPTNKPQEKEEATTEYKDIDEDETVEHIIESESIDSFYDDQVDSDEVEVDE